MTNVLITGITGTLGQAVSQKLLSHKDLHIYGLSRDEQKQRLIPPHKRQTLILGDVRDQTRVLESTRNIDLLFHFAALKCVDTLEDNPEESIRTNVNGTENVLYSQRINKIKRVVLSSTDKACKPINVYGACKLLSEKLVLRNSNNVVVRYGNVLASRGSVIPMFVKTIQEKGLVEITDINMTRFFIRIDDAAEFVIQSALGKDGGLKIFNMKSVSILDLAYAISELIGVKKPIVRVTGMRAGEKIHEDLCHEYERSDALTSQNSLKYSKDELFKLLGPIVDKLKVKKPFPSKFQENILELRN